MLAAFQSTDDMARQGHVTTLSEAESYVSRLVDPAGVHRAFAITDADLLVGLVVVSLDRDNLVGWFWYWMSRSHRNRGWTGRAAATIADWALRDGGVHRLELGHRADNPASAGVALAAGFVREGVEREKFLIDGERVDVVTYGRLPSDPWPSAPAVLPGENSVRIATAATATAPEGP